MYVLKIEARHSFLAYYIYGILFFIKTTWDYNCLKIVYEYVILLKKGEVIFE